MNTLRTGQAILALSTLTLSVGFTKKPQPSRSTLQAAAVQGPIFPKGARGPAANFTGVVYVTSLVKDDPTFTCNAGSVSFEPGARTYWHAHPAGQILMVTDGTGYYQEVGQPVRLLHKGDVVQCQPGVKHWHGASPKLPMTHIAIVTNTEKGVVTWLQPVTDKEYDNYK
jgi:quercetin dioxygenase-like cupin family protein